MNTETTKQATSLQCKILAVNTLNRDCQTILTHELNQLKKFVGQNILKVDGSFKSKINHVKTDIPKQNINEYGFNWWIDTTYYIQYKYNTLRIEVCTCVTGGGADKNGVNRHCIYERRVIDIFNVDNDGNLQDLEKINFEPVQYNELDILAAKQEIDKAAQEYKKTLEKMPYIFHDVMYCERLTR